MDRNPARAKHGRTGGDSGSRGFRDGSACVAAFVITPYFDASVTSDMQGAINLAIGNIEALYSNPGTVGIVFQAQPGSFLGESEASDYTASWGRPNSRVTSRQIDQSIG